MKSRIYIEAIDCTTSTAKSPGDLWDALVQGRSGIKKVNSLLWPARFQEYWREQNHIPCACKIESDSSSLDTLTKFLSASIKKVLLNTDRATGIIFSTTKGAVEDVVWESDFFETIDPLELVLSAVIKKNSHLNFKYQQVVSNSCASSHASMALAKKWLESGACEKVLIIAGDIVGAFIHTGFQSLKALSVESVKPFQENRDGLVLGEAFTAIVLSSTPSEFEILDCQIFNEAHTVTGASPEGRGLFECIKRLDVQDHVPDFAIAHGTATFLNDQIEDRVFLKAQELFKKDFPITGTKWSVGHTLGASGSVDVIAAMMSLKNQEVFSFHADSDHHTGFVAKNYLYKKTHTKKLEVALITSLGFGGTNGALMIKRHA